jgi:hypothetical protein
MYAASRNIVMSAASSAATHRKLYFGAHVESRRGILEMANSSWDSIRIKCFLRLGGRLLFRLKCSAGGTKGPTYSDVARLAPYPYLLRDWTLSCEPSYRQPHCCQGGD